ncbi:MAG: hypothetical protein J2P21_17820 [Chloracidobacterium sp.]|nr:hypothetical protein [Chloracidobacterium sp.]
MSAAINAQYSDASLWPRRQLLLDGKTYYRKEASTGHYQTLYGEQMVERHLYQTSAGGETICPMEINCQMIFGSATPLLAEIASFKLVSMTGTEAERDMAKSHGLKLSDNYLREIALQVGKSASQIASNGKSQRLR